ncbi:PIR Superfamily Protein [Plasmodium ovale wallikeri]|uniref:PIR Superfamily Protein n=2 Tax=Plasmodium ovale TaxID=36330 RepID=A0A1A9A6S9_PLAOA|nr:PIR Superfamily Protein [Plasmodium ovale curtisi]SBT52184.1 PIR Superfamily Protein [Plasmodium ovale wallikeri]SBT59321.1 PIR Superfamily Protein [Plasmodium ovale wallikeri]
MNFAEAEEYYKLVNKFQTFKSEFTKHERDSSGYYNYACEEVTKHILENTENYKNICLDVLHYLMYMKKLDSPYDKHESCMFLNFYLNNSLHEIRNNKLNATKFYSNIKNNWNRRYINLSVCEQDIKDIHPFVFYTIQTIFTLYDNLYNYRNTPVPNDISHCPYAHNFVSIYNNFKNVCAVHYRTSFCQKIIKIKDEYNEYVKYEEKCANVEKDLKNPEKIELSKVLQISGPHANSLGEHHMLGNTSNPMGNNISVPFAIVLVTPFLFFILYKFTPLGPILRPHLHKYLGISGNNNEKNDKLHSNNFTDDETETHNSGYHITYNSLAQ